MRRTSFSTITHTLDTATSITILHFKKKSKKKHETKRIKFEIVARNIGRLPNVQAHTHTSIEWRIQQILNFATQTHDYFFRLCNNKRRGKAKRNILCYYIAQHRIDHIPFLVENKIFDCNHLCASFIIIFGISVQFISVWPFSMGFDQL